MMGLLDMMKGNMLDPWKEAQGRLEQSGGWGADHQAQQQQPPPSATPQQMSGMDKFKNFGQQYGPGLAQAFNTMRLDPDQGVNRAAEFQNMRFQQGQEQNKTVAYLESLGEQEMADAVRANPKLGSQMIIELQRRKHATPNESFEVKTGEELGLPPGGYNVSKTSGKITKIGGGGVNVTTQNMGNIPAGYQLTEENGVKAMSPIPGSPAALEMENSSEKAANLQDQTSKASSTVVQDLETARQYLSQTYGDTGNEFIDSNMRVASSQFPAGTASKEATRAIDSVKSNIGIDQLMKMKRNSPTGGALGAVPFQQQQRLESLLGALDVGMHKDTLANNMDRITNLYLDGIHGNRRTREQQLEAGQISQETFNEIDSQYKPLPFDRAGRPWPVEQRPPSGTSLSQEEWLQIPAERRANAWAKWALRNDAGAY